MEEFYDLYCSHLRDHSCKDAYELAEIDWQSLHGGEKKYSNLQCFQTQMSKNRRKQRNKLTRCNFQTYPVITIN